jgi:hypothetical protein
MRDVSAKLRATFYRKPKSVRFFAETGVIKRYIEMTMLNDDWYTITNSKEATAMNETRWSATNVLVPHFALGAEMTLRKEGVLDRKYWTIGSMLQLSAPATTVIRSELFSIEVRNFSLAFYGRFFF